MCKTILSVEELLIVLNASNIDSAVKKSYLHYLTVVYIASPFNIPEIGTADFAHCPYVGLQLLAYLLLILILLLH